MNLSTSSLSTCATPSLQKVVQTVNLYYPRLLGSVRAMLAVFGAMALKGRTKPLTLIFEAASGMGKTAVLQMAFPLSADPQSPGCVYRSDKFTPRSFVSHAANVTTEQLAKIDLLPKVANKVLITKELAPILRGRKEELEDNFSILISVLDGKGFTSDSGIRGRRGYERPIVFNWIGATTPLPAATHRLMSQLGTRLLFYDVPTVVPTEEELLAFASKDEAGTAELECQQAMNEFLADFFERHLVGTVQPDSIVIDGDATRRIVRLAQLLVHGRAEVKFDELQQQPIAAGPPEGPYKVIGYFKELARGQALIHGRTMVDDSDLELVEEVALSSIPGHLGPIVRELRCYGQTDSARCARICAVSARTARKYLAEVDVLGIGVLEKGQGGPQRLTLAKEYRWLRDDSAAPSLVA